LSSPIISSSNIPSIQRIKFEDYKGAPQWFEQFLSTLNLFFTAVYNIINHGITYANLGVIQPFTFVFTPGSTTGFKFANPLIQPPTNVIIGNVYAGTQLQNHPAVATQIYWHYSQGFIFVDSVVGLTSGIQYTIAVQVS
jgi:hypothetical protein